MKKLIFFLIVIVFSRSIALERSLYKSGNLSEESLSEQEEETIASMAQALNKSESWILNFGINEPLKLEGCNASSPEDATQQLQKLFDEVDGFRWHVFRQQAACLIGLYGASVDIKQRDFPQFPLLSTAKFPLLSTAVGWQDYLFVKFLIEHGAKPSRRDLYGSKSVLMAKLLIENGANLLEPIDAFGNVMDPLNIVLDLESSPELLEFYINEYGSQVVKKYEYCGIQNNYNLLHCLLVRDCFIFYSNDPKKKIFILLKYGVDPNEKNAAGESAIEMAQKKAPRLKEAFNEAINEHRKDIDELKHILVLAIKCDYDLAEEIIQYNRYVI